MISAAIKTRHGSLQRKVAAVQMPRSGRLQLSHASNRTAACWGTVDDGSFQERYYPGRVHGTSLKNPDFAAYARAFGAYGELVKPPSSSRPRSSGRFSPGRPALLELRLAAEAITPLTTLSTIRDEALKQTPRQRRGSPH